MDADALYGMLCQIPTRVFSCLDSIASEQLRWTEMTLTMSYKSHRLVMVEYTPSPEDI